MSVRPAFLPSAPADLEICDPGGLMRAALCHEPPAAGVRDLLLCWLLRLPAGLDPALAAGRLLACSSREPAEQPSELRALLREVARWPRTRLARHLPAHRRPH